MAVAALFVVMVTSAQTASRSAGAAQRDDVAVDLAAVTLTMADLEDAGLVGYRVFIASPDDSVGIVYVDQDYPLFDAAAGN